MTGHVVVDIGALRTEVPVDVAASHVLDIAFTHPGGLVDTRVFFRAGMIDFVWTRAALRRLPGASSARRGCRPRPAGAGGR